MQLLEEYLDSILEQVHPLTPIELPIEEALDHVLACDLEARVAVPPFPTRAWMVSLSTLMKITRPHLSIP